MIAVLAKSTVHALKIFLSGRQAPGLEFRLISLVDPAT